MTSFFYGAFFFSHPYNMSLSVLNFETNQTWTCEQIYGLSTGLRCSNHAENVWKNNKQKRTKKAVAGVVMMEYIENLIKS